MSQIKIGWSEVDITPKEKISLAGQFFERISDEVESELKAIAWAVESDGEAMIICEADLVSIGDNLHGEVKRIVSEKTGIPESKIITGAIHSHTSYTYERWMVAGGSDFGKKYLDERLPEDMKYEPLVSGEECMSPKAALDFLIEKLSEACISAWNNRAPGYYKNAFGRVAVGMCRRVSYDDGSTKMWGDTNHPNFTELEGGNDSGMELIFTYDENKNLSGIVANIACPAQVVEHRSFISSDYWGKVRENIKKKYGDVKVLGLCSAAGDQCPRDMIRWVNPESPIDDPNIKREGYIERRADPSMFDVSGLKLVGKRISNEIISVFEELDGELESEAILVHETINLTMPLRKVTIAEYNNAIEKIDDFIAKNRGKHTSFEDAAALHVYSGTLSRYALQKIMSTYEDEIHIIRFGDVAIATNPYELFLDYGNRIRARSLAKQTFLIQLSCGSRAYLPTEKAEKGSHYSAYVSSGMTGHEGGDILVAATLDHLNKMFK